jgi:membrane-bound acyltransferase YfiQ involved in biofilm formation
MSQRISARFYPEKVSKKKYLRKIRKLIVICLILIGLLLVLNSLSLLGINLRK